MAAISLADGNVRRRSLPPHRRPRHAAARARGANPPAPHDEPGAADQAQATQAVARRPGRLSAGRGRPPARAARAARPPPGSLVLLERRHRQAGASRAAPSSARRAPAARSTRSPGPCCGSRRRSGGRSRPRRPGSRARASGRRGRRCCDRRCGRSPASCPPGRCQVPLCVVSRPWSSPWWCGGAAYGGSGILTCRSSNVARTSSLTSASVTNPSVVLRPSTWPAAGSTKPSTSRLPLTVAVIWSPNAVQGDLVRPPEPLDRLVGALLREARALGVAIQRPGARRGHDAAAHSPPCRRRAPSTMTRSSMTRLRRALRDRRHDLERVRRLRGVAAHGGREEAAHLALRDLERELLVGLDPVARALPAALDLLEVARSRPCSRTGSSTRRPRRDATPAPTASANRLPQQ